MKQYKILAIGNSFSEDATYYLHKISKAADIDTKVVNLYIGGCPLEKHWANIQSGEKLYMRQENGVLSETYVSVQEALAEEDWDSIVTQQASHDSGLSETYYPYCELLYDYLRQQKPDAKLWMQQTWAYEIDSTHDCFPRYNKDQKLMYEKLCEAYQEASRKAGVELIPCGDTIQMVRGKKPFIYQEGGMSLCRDGFHMHYLYGRYLLAAVWYEKILHKSILDNPFVPETDYLPGEKADLQTLQVIKECVHQAAAL